MHDGYKNTYTFQKDGAMITLGPVKETEVSRSFMRDKQVEADQKERSKNLLSREEFLEKLQGESVVFMLVIIEASRDSKAPSPQLQKMFEEFRDVIT